MGTPRISTLAAEFPSPVLSRTWPGTVTAAFRSTVATRPDEVALRWRGDDGWESWTWREYADRVARTVAGLRDLGVAGGERVVLMLRSRPEFHVVDMAALFAGAVPVSIYNSSSVDQIHYVLGHAAPVAAVVEQPFLERVLEARGGRDGLRHLIVVSEPANGPEPGEGRADGVVGFPQLLAGAPVELAKADAARPEGLATLTYTSGTTGAPKAVEITHANVASAVRSIVEAVGHRVAGWRMLSCLPMAHVAERVATHYVHAFEGTEVTTCRDVLHLAEHLREVRPHAIFSVPSLWEKTYASVRALASSSPQAREFDDALAVGREVDAVKSEGRAVPAELAEKWEAADRTLSVVRALLGMDRVEVAVTTAAPIFPGVITFFRSLGVPLSELYGLSETTGPLTWDPYRVRPGDVGRPIPGCEVRLAADGEVLARGGNVFAGYFNDPPRTTEALDADGWLHTGDLGVLEDGRLRIVGRKKDLIVTAGGENVSPSNIETALRSEPLIGQACVAGDRRPHLVALVTLDPDALGDWARRHGHSSVPPAELLELPDLRAEVDREVAEVNRHVGRVEQVRRFALLGGEWSADSELLTATMKVRRAQVLATYAAEIDALYG
ncbi:MAG TPA: AMP-dependent synthetase/ligase [Acidimicrobiales bacterium]|nr:AMP-dependent synthetase/ligase [Acidimicrobiales bacterium]